MKPLFSFINFGNVDISQPSAILLLLAALYAFFRSELVKKTVGMILENFKIREKLADGYKEQRDELLRENAKLQAKIELMEEEMTRMEEEFRRSHEQFLRAMTRGFEEYTIIKKVNNDEQEN